LLAVWRLLSILVLVAVALAGCGDDEGGGGDNGKPGSAGAFVECFELDGFDAARPKPREESLLAFQARRKGYDVEPVNVVQAGSITPHAFLVFFASDAKAKEAMDELDATAYGPERPQVRGPVVIGYGDVQNRAAVEPAIAKCL
jgi:hypothetical protein